MCNNNNWSLRVLDSYYWRVMHLPKCRKGEQHGEEHDTAVYNITLRDDFGNLNAGNNNCVASRHIGICVHNAHHHILLLYTTSYTYNVHRRHNFSSTVRDTVAHSIHSCIMYWYTECLMRWRRYIQLTLFFFFLANSYWLISFCAASLASPMRHIIVCAMYIARK